MAGSAAACMRTAEHEPEHQGQPSKGFQDRTACGRWQPTIALGVLSHLLRPVLRMRANVVGRDGDHGQALRLVVLGQGNNGLCRVTSRSVSGCGCATFLQHESNSESRPRGARAPFRWTTKGQWLQRIMKSVAEAPLATSSRDTSFLVRGSGSCACTPNSIPQSCGIDHHDVQQENQICK